MAPFFISPIIDSILSLFLIVQPDLNNYDRVVQNLQQISQHPSANARMVVIGTNDKGVAIQALKIGHGAVNALVVAGHHGNEYGSTAVAMGFAAELARNPIEGLTTYVVPVLNIGGYNQNNRYESNAQQSVDPNRDYTSPCKTDAAFTLQSTKALADFVDKNNIVISATLHTYFPAVLYPWGVSTSDLSTGYDDEFLRLAQIATAESGYQYGNATQVLYAADGTFEDYAFWKHGIWSLLFEMGNSHTPNQQELKKMIEVNTPGLRRFLEQAPKARATEHSFLGNCSARVLRRVWLE